MPWERITASEVEVGDWIARTRNHPAHRVNFVSDGERSRYITCCCIGRIRPRHGTKLWRSLGHLV